MCATEEEKEEREEGGEERESRDTRGSLRNYSMVRYRYPVAAAVEVVVLKRYRRPLSVDGRAPPVGFQVGGAVDRRSRSGIERSLR